MRAHTRAYGKSKTVGLVGQYIKEYFIDKI